MKKYVLAFLLLLSYAAQSQQSTTVQKEEEPEDNAFKIHSWVPTVSIGFINGYRTRYTVPPGFDKGSTTGFAPIYARLEYGVSDRVSIAFNTAFNTIYFNSFILDTGYNGPVRRFATNKFKLFSAGLTGYWHFGHVLNVHNLDPFIGGGICLNNIQYSAFPDADSTIIKKEHTATPFIKAGVRYFISEKAAIYVDAGYDKLTVFTVGFSCRFFSRRYRYY